MAQALTSFGACTLVKGSSATITGMHLGVCLFLSIGKLSFLKKENKLDISGTDDMFSFMGVKSGRT